MSRKPAHEVSADDLEIIISNYLAKQLEVSGNVSISDLTRIAVGWSHETWLFDADWRNNDGEHQRLELCLRRDPGNALLREASDLEEQFIVLKCLENSDLPSP